MLGHFVPRKRFNPYRMCLWRRFVRENVLDGTENSFCGKIFSRVGWLHYNATLSFDAPGVGGASGGSLRSSRQAVACHPFTRSWATMPPETPPPPPGFSEDLIFVVPLCIYICSLKQQYREICVKMQQSLCELHLCRDG